MDISSTITQLRENFRKGQTQSLKFRLQQLDGISRFLTEKETEIYQALQQDLGKPKPEAFIAEIASIRQNLHLTRKKLAQWLKPQRVKTPLIARPGKSYVIPEPYGVVLIIGAWNYPLNLVLTPLIGALAAGNCAVIKPSEVAAQSSHLLATLLPKYLDPRVVQVIEGGVPETTALLAQVFDYIFYTGNNKIARIIMDAAAKNLTPVTLELGGKSPCIVDQQTDIKVAARRIIYGKCFNAGQTCIAADYVLAHQAIIDELLIEMKKACQAFYGDNPLKNPDYGCIINTQHWQRLMNLLPGSGKIYYGGENNAAQRFIAPTILVKVPLDAPIMQEEIFGPILPVLSVQNMQQAIDYINAHPKPLALYLFSANKGVQKQVLAKTSSGAVNINNIAYHFMAPTLPFGGVGASGMGAYHGKFTFETFSHYKSVLINATWFNPPFIYPPYNKLKLQLLRWLLH